MGSSTWVALAGPFLAGCVLLVGAGATKVADPMPLVRALRSAGLPAPRAGVRVVALAEVAVGLWGAWGPSRLAAALVALSYAAFTVFVLLASARGGVLASCGCFGRADTPPTRTHAVVTGLFALAAAAVSRVPPVVGLLERPPAEVAGAAATGALIAFLAWQVLAVLPLVTPAAIRSTQRG